MQVSIGIPFYNNEQTLVDTIRSVFAQTYQGWELILVDDGSSDRSLEIARSVDDERVRVITDGQNKKLPARLNQIAQGYGQFCSGAAEAYVAIKLFREIANSNTV